MTLDVKTHELTQSLAFEKSKTESLDKSVEFLREASAHNESNFLSERLAAIQAHESYVQERSETSSLTAMNMAMKSKIDEMRKSSVPDDSSPIVIKARHDKNEALATCSGIVAELQKLQLDQITSIEHKNSEALASASMETMSLREELATARIAIKSSVDPVSPPKNTFGAPPIPEAQDPISCSPISTYIPLPKFSQPIPVTTLPTKLFVRDTFSGSAIELPAGDRPLAITGPALSTVQGQSSTMTVPPWLSSTDQSRAYGSADHPGDQPNGAGKGPSDEPPEDRG